MANPQLSVEITAKIDGLRKGFAEAVAETKSFEGKITGETSKTSKAYEKLSNDVGSSMSKAASTTKAASNSISKDLAKAAQASSTSGKAISVGSNQAAFALSNLGRVAQDAPFGFIGIQNNLNPLLESFQRLRSEAGSNAGALKALAGSLIGPGGIGLALSVVSSLYLVYQQYAQKAAKADEERAKNTKSAKEALDEYIKSLDASTRAQVAGIANSQKELITLRQLYDASRNVAIPMEERKKAAKELQEQYPQTFKNFSEEQIALGKASSAYQQLATDIIAVAKAAARTDILVENEKEIVQLNEKRKVLERNLKTQKEAEERAINASKQTQGNVGGSGFSESNQGLRDLKAAATETDKRLSTEQQIKTVGNQIAIKRRESLGIEKEMTAEVVKQQSVVSLTGIDTDKDKGNREKKIKSLAEILAELATELKINEAQLDKTFSEKGLANLNSYQKAIDELTKNGFKPQGAEIQNLVTQYEKLAKVLRGGSLESPVGGTRQGTGTILNGFDPTGKVKGTDTRKRSSIEEEYDSYVKGLEKALDKFISLEGQARLAASAVSDIGISIGEALATGGNVFAAVGDSLIQSFGSFLSQFGKLLVEYGVAAALKAKLDASLAIPGAALITAPLAIAAGVALQIAAGAFNSIGKNKTATSKAGGKNVPGFAGGVSNFTGGLAVVGERGPELVNLPKGSDVIPNNRSMSMIRRGGENLTVNGVFKIGARELVATIDNERNLNKRLR